MNMAFTWKNSQEPQKFKRPTWVKCLFSLLQNPVQPSELKKKNTTGFYPFYHSTIPLIPNYSSTQLWDYAILEEKKAHLYHSVCSWICLSLPIHPFLISIEFHSFPITCILEKCHGCNFAFPLCLTPWWVIGCILELALWKGWDNWREICNRVLVFTNQLSISCAC